MANTIYQKLLKIQSEIKAPKNQFNKFGGYNYRNCEDILEALKPILLDVKATLTITDEVEMIGDRFYIKSMATLLDTESDGFVKSFGFAREPVSKKGMDEAQVTGSTSSYARKYALNGLFLIDDNKDSDYTNNGNNEQKQNSNRNQGQNKTLEQYRREIAQILNAKKIPPETFVSFLKREYKVDKLENLNLKQIQEVKGKVASW